MDAWVPMNDVIPLCKAMLETYRDLGSRRNRQKTRMMWLTDEMGIEEFRAEVERRMLSCFPHWLRLAFGRARRV
uniref:Nitrite/sulphite reductase 4Fe-4S domain-containing protein n=1 Tax=Physcomitrium patens TaxID=3218 RepID=A0A2K1KH76_PHYPA|nr:hypothetical protein PHYPA_009509 [Physcomitrium patens]